MRNEVTCSTIPAGQYPLIAGNAVRWSRSLSMRMSDPIAWYRIGVARVSRPYRPSTDGTTGDNDAYSVCSTVIYNTYLFIYLT